LKDGDKLTLIGELEKKDDVNKILGNIFDCVKLGIYWLVIFHFKRIY
jgi:hypothetical protein